MRIARTGDCFWSTRISATAKSDVHRLLFLLGGSEGDILGRVADEFVPAAGGPDAAIALLLMGGPGWRDHAPEYTAPWMDRSARRHHVIVPDDQGKLDLEAASARIAEATGIFIGGGHTPTYHRLYASEPIRSLIRERHQQGVPVAGLSAGALIAPAICMMQTRAPGEPPTRSEVGLGLVSEVIVDVHFDQPGRLGHLLATMIGTRTSLGFGVGVSAGIVFDNGVFARAIGGPAYRVTMTDFTAPLYAIEPLSDPPPA